MADRTDDVYINRVWVDWDAPLFLGPRITVYESWAFIAVSVSAAWITMWAPAYWRSTNRVCIRIVQWCKARRRPQRGNEECGKDSSDMSSTSPQRQGTPIIEAMATSRTADEGVIRLLKRVLRDLRDAAISSKEVDPHPPESLIQRTQHQVQNVWIFLRRNQIDICLTLLAIGYCFFNLALLAVAATAAAYLETGHIALSNMRSCYLGYNSGSEMGQMGLAVEAYYSNCHENGMLPKRCRLFSDENLPIKITDNERCPFYGDVCLLGENSALTLDTGYVKANTLGINLQRSLYVRRRRTCAPVVTDGYTQVERYPGSEFRTKFYYGQDMESLEITNYTFLSIRSVGEVLGNNFGTYGLCLATHNEFHALHREFTSPMGDSSLLLIDAPNIQYEERSDDPIFPAKDEVRCWDTACWKHLRPHGTVLGCVEKDEVCPPNEPCLNSKDVSSLGSDESDLSFHIAIALAKSSLGADTSAIRTRLDAEKRIDKIPSSRPLDKEQWKLEARRLFEMSVLRAKMELLTLARGKDIEFLTKAGFPLPKATQMRESGVCTRYKFQVYGYKNLTLAGLSCALFIPLLHAIRIKDEPLILWLPLVAWKLLRWTFTRAKLGVSHFSLAQCRKPQRIFHFRSKKPRA